MLKNFVLIYFSLALTGLSAQELDIQINWTGIEDYSSDDVHIEVPHFEGAIYDLPESVIPILCSNVEVSFWNYSDLRLTNVVASPLEGRELALVQGSNNNEFSIEGSVSGKDRSPRLSFCISTIRKNEDGQWEKLLSAKLEWSADQTERANKTAGFAPNSVLASGNWYKVSVSKDGIYKLTPQYLSEIGFGTNNQISNIGVFGNGSGQLPEVNSEFRYDDLQENAIQVFDGNGDGIFNGNDYLLFYGRGPKRWSYNVSDDRFSHQNHHYSDLNYYFITNNSGNGKQVSQVSYNPGTVTHSINSFDDFQFIEEDNINLIGTGRKWYGDLFDFKLQFNYSFSFPNLIASEPMELYTVAVARSLSSGTNMRVDQGGSQISVIPFSAVSSGSGDDYVRQSSSRDQFNSSSSNITLTYTYNNNVNPSAVAWLDFIELRGRRELKLSGNAMFFRDTESLGVGNVAEYSVDGLNSNDVIWDLTDYINPARVNFTLNGSVASFKAPSDSLREFVVIRGSSFPEPSQVGNVANQNLHGLAGVEMVIVSHSSFLSEANRLAQFHRDNDGLSVEVIDTRLIYNEFSSGAQDITAIKDLMRSLYEKASTPQEEPKYLLLFGDASFDYKGRVEPNHNYVPIYESPRSFSFYSSFSTDDYYGFLDQSEGINMRTEFLDLGIGRFPVTSASEAKTAVDKVIHYATSQNTYSNWRNNILFVSDDVDISWEMVLTTEPDYIARNVERDYPAFNVQKIYSDSYIQKSSAGSQRYPEAREELFRKVESGNLITTYFGHGGEVGWATERILQLDDVNGWSNLDAMPVFTTITCEFSRLDDPARVSAGEQLFKNPKGGAVSLYSTTRVVFVNSAISINRTFYDTVFGRINGQYQTMGQIMQNTKNQVLDEIRLKFSLLGDPALKMNIPEYQIKLLNINGDPIGPGADTLKALSSVNMQGEVLDIQGNKLSSFSGVVSPRIFDKSIQKQTLMNDGQGSPINFKLFENVIYNGKVSVENGEFDFDFIVPLDINYNIGPGKANFYASSFPDDAHGSDTAIRVGGLNTLAAIDKIGPDINLFINDPSFVSGGITNTNPIIYAEVFDSSGINTVGNGIGHDLIAVLDDNVNNTLVLNDFYEADLDSYQSGKIQYPLYNLEPGDHKLLIRVWDVYNNPSEKVVHFKVSESRDLQLSRVLNWPNPFTTYTEFQFEHNRASEPLEVQVQIYSVSGQLIKTINQSVMASGNRISGIKWDGKDQFGDEIGKGVYVYRLRVRSTLDNSYAEKTEKLVILN